jgi:hypothetical protein
MSTTDEKRPKARSGQRGGKAKQAGPKADQRQRAKPEPTPVEAEVVETAVSMNEILPVEVVAAHDPTDINALDPTDIEPAPAPAEPLTNAALVPVSPAPVVVAGPVETFWIGFQTIAAAYRTCAWRSIEETMGLVEKLALTPSLEKTIEVQNEFTRKACDGAVADSQKIWRLYGEVTRQIYLSFERLLVWRRPVAR